MKKNTAIVAAYWGEECLGFAEREDGKVLECDVDPSGENAADEVALWVFKNMVRRWVGEKPVLMQLAEDGK